MSDEVSSPGTAIHLTVSQDGHSTVFVGVKGRKCVAVVRASTDSAETLYKMANIIAKYAKECMDKEKKGAPK